MNVFQTMIPYSTKGPVYIQIGWKGHAGNIISRIGVTHIKEGHIRSFQYFLEFDLLEVGLKNMTHKRLFIFREERYFEQLEADCFISLGIFYTILRYN